MRFLVTRLIRFWPWLCALLIFPATGHADPEGVDPTQQSLRLSGFGTAGYVAGGNSELYFVRDWTQAATEQTNNGFLADSRLGVQANYTINADWEAVAQLVSRYKAEPTWENAVEWAFLSYHPSTDSTIRVGRVGMDIFALSDYRNVGYAYNWVRPPTEYYGWIVLYSLDGIDLATNLNFFDTLIRPKLFFGSTDSTIPTAGNAFKFHSKDDIGTSILMDHDFWRFRLSYVHIKAASPFPFSSVTAALDAATPVWPQASGYENQFNVVGAHIQYGAAALGYDDGSWQVQSEFSHTTASIAFLPEGNRGYISLGRRFEDWLPFVTFSKSTDPLHLQVVAPSGYGLEPVAAETAYLLNLNRIRQTTWSAGVRWDFTNNMAWKLQVDRSKIARPGAALWDVITPNWPGGSRTLVSTSVDFIF